MRFYVIKQRIKKWLRKKFPKVVVKKKVVAPVVSKPAPVLGRGVQKRPVPIKKCFTTHKFMFTRDQAEKRKAVLLRKKTASYLRVYLCQFCGKWHLTHKKDLMRGK